MTVADSRLIQNDQDFTQSISYMKSLIDGHENIDWSAYNIAKKKFLVEFKALENNGQKQKIWKDFVEVSDAARAMKKIHEEVGEFAAEMISKALDAIDVELESTQSLTFTHHFPVFDKVTEFKSYKSKIVEKLAMVAFLSKKASQVQELRQELMKTGMRLSLKGKLFDRLSKIGDIVFPKKKELSNEIIEDFKKALLAFCQKNAKQTEGSETLFQIRLIQGFLKSLSLKKQDFDFVKSLLDPIWKKATVDKDLKEKAFEETVAKSQEAKKTIEESFEALSALIEQNQDTEALKLYDEIQRKFKEKTLTKTDFRVCKDSLESKAKPLFERLDAIKEKQEAAVKMHAELIKQKRSDTVELFRSTKDIENKEKAFEVLLSMNLPIEEIYEIRYELFLAKFEAINDASVLEDLYVELKDFQEVLRTELSSSSLNFSLSLALCDVTSNVKQLLNKVLKALE